MQYGLWAYCTLRFCAPPGSSRPAAQRLDCILPFNRVPQTANWLPAEEAARLRLAFETELARLEAA